MAPLSSWPTLHLSTTSVAWITSDCHSVSNCIGTNTSCSWWVWEFYLMTQTWKEKKCLHSALCLLVQMQETVQKPHLAKHILVALEWSTLYLCTASPFFPSFHILHHTCKWVLFHRHRTYWDQPHSHCQSVGCCHRFSLKSWSQFSIDFTQNWKMTALAHHKTLHISHKEPDFFPRIFYDDLKQVLGSFSGRSLCSTLKMLPVQLGGRLQFPSWRHVTFPLPW